MEAKRLRKIAAVGMVVGIALAILGQLPSLTALFIVGLTVSTIGISATSYFILLSWLYARALKKEMKEEAKPPPAILCPRCGAEIRSNLKYCPKCGKKIQAKKT